MQFAVPQFTEVEDRLIGSLTLKQFLVLLAAGGVDLFLWSVFGPTLPFFIVGLPIGLLGIAIALGRYNGRPLFIYLMPFAAYASSTKVMVFKRETSVTSVSRSQPAAKPMPQEPATPESLEPAESRLKKLAYLLDRKTEEEGDIIGSDTRQDIIVPQAPNIDLGKTISRAKSQVSEVKDLITESAVGGPKPGAAPRSRPAGKPQPKKFDPSSFLQI